MACMKEERDVVRQVEIIVSSKFVSCRPSFTSTISDSCLMVTFVGQDASSPWPNKTIAGFYYEQGFEYRILVKATKLANPPMDSGDTEFELIKVISKTKVN
ncbi:Uncharacterised protein [Sphingobacterium spiritivorum]|uniref:DUF4377 domain-containing protein n=2 Tax=Sphingobacterium spiritivorum TaxID=258 RepID=A0A380CRH9_SPHSI|nr:Uncharacterised protein [Sphingobacterium spiritivorum]